MQPGSECLIAGGLPCACALQHGWQVAGGVITFKGGAEGGKGPKELPPMTIINNALIYAKELERIV
jgi:26S proteasome regulatory subunit N12